MAENRNNEDFKYTVVLDGNYSDVTGGKDVVLQPIDGGAPEERDEHTESMDRLYYDYEKMCLKDPTVLDKDDIYPHTYHWRSVDKYDEGKEAVLKEALRKRCRIVDTEEYEKYIEGIKNRRFTPVSWD